MFKKYKVTSSAMSDISFGIYVHQSGLISVLGIVRRDFEDNLGIQVDGGDCICKQPSLENMPDVVLCHPAPINNNGCYDRIRSAIERSPASQFYIMVMERPERKTIGAYSNVTYIERDKFQEAIDEIKQRLGIKEEE